MSYQYPFIPGHSSMPTTPQTTFRWDAGDQQRQGQQQQHLEQQILQHPLQHQPEQNQDAYTTTSPSTTVSLQEQVPVVPSQSLGRPGSSGRGVSEGDELQMRLQHVSVPAGLQPEHMRPPMIDTKRAYHVGTSASPPSGPPSAGPSGVFHGAIGPVRARISPVQVDPRARAHPYQRPQSAAGVVIARSRREPEDGQSVRFRSRHASSSSTMHAPLSATTPTATTMQKGLPLAAKMIKTIKGMMNAGHSSAFMIRTDLHFNNDTSVLTALCELPGVSKDDVSVVLSTNVMNRVKQVVVHAKSPQDLADDGIVVRERKLGDSSRTLVVPKETTPEDILVEMRDGLLSLKIQFPPPLSDDGSQDLVIR